MAAFSAGATFVLVEKYSARAFWGQVQKYRATITECIPMMIRTLMVQPPSANRSATPPAGSDVLSQLVGAGKRCVL